MRQDRKLRKIALIVEGRVQYERNLLLGIREYASSRDEWLIRLEMPGKGTSDFVKHWKPDGILFQSAGLSPEVVDHISRKRNAIHLSESPPGTSLRSVGLDNAEIGRSAAEYFLERRFENFAFAGVGKSGFSRTRGDSFCSAIKSRGYPVAEFDVGSMGKESEVVRWLKSLPRPCAIFSTHDECSLFLTTVCRSAGISIPDEIAILGVDDDQLICELAWPQLSSISVPSRKVGREAAQWLDSLIAGKKGRRKSLLLPPTGIVTRHSTEVHHTEDETVNRALQFMQTHLSQRVNVDDVLRDVGISRRLLERKFAHQLGRSPLREIQRLRLKEVKRLLLETRVPLHEIASRCGFSDASRLIAFFRKDTGITPGQFRKAKRVSIQQG